MFSQRAHPSTLTGAVLGVCGFLSNTGLPAPSAHAQDRIFAFASGYRNNLTPQDAPLSVSRTQIRFSRELAADLFSLPSLKAALHDQSALRISWGSLKANPKTLGCEMVLSDGSCLTLNLATISPCKLSKVSRLTATGDGYRCDIPTRSIRAMRPSPNVEYDQAWNELRSGQDSDDRLAIRRPSGVLDTMHGVAIAISPQDIEFLIDGETYRIPLGKIEGIVFADETRTTPTTGRTALQNSDHHSYLFAAGSRILCSQLDANSDRESGFIAETPGGALITLLPEHPFILDRTEQYALTPHQMKIIPKRSFNSDAYTRALPLGERLLTLAPHSHTITGEGLDTRWRIFGPTELQIEIPSGPHTLVFEPVLSHLLPTHVEMYVEDAQSSSRTLFYSTSPAATPQATTTPERDYRIKGPGSISIVVPPDELIDLRSFLIFPDR